MAKAPALCRLHRWPSCISCASRPAASKIQRSHGLPHRLSRVSLRELCRDWRAAARPVRHGARAAHRTAHGPPDGAGRAAGGRAGRCAVQGTLLQLGVFLKLVGLVQLLLPQLEPTDNRLAMRCFPACRLLGGGDHGLQSGLPNDDVQGGQPLAPAAALAAAAADQQRVPRAVLGGGARAPRHGAAGRQHPAQRTVLILCNAWHAPAM